MAYPTALAVLDLTLPHSSLISLLLCPSSPPFTCQHHRAPAQSGPEAKSSPLPLHRGPWVARAVLTMHPAAISQPPLFPTDTLSPTDNPTRPMPTPEAAQGAGAARRRSRHQAAPCPARLTLRARPAAQGRGAAAEALKLGSPSVQKVNAVFIHGLINHIPKDSRSCIHVYAQLQLDTVIHFYTHDVYIKYHCLYYTIARVFILKILGRLFFTVRMIGRGCPEKVWVLPWERSRPGWTGLEQPALVEGVTARVCSPPTLEEQGGPRHCWTLGLGISVTSSPLWAVPGLQHPRAPCCSSAFSSMASPEPPPAHSKGTEQGINFGPFPMFFSLHPTLHRACSSSPLLPAPCTHCLLSP